MSEADKKRQQQKHEAIIAELLKQPDNRTCADCGEKGPRWASWNIGCFLCLRCAGIHRRMGTHISRVKSVNLDTWTEEQIESIKSKGNAHVNEHYNPNPQRHPIPPLNDDTAMEHYIREKYEKKAFMGSQRGVEPVRIKEGSGGPGYASAGAGGQYRDEVSKLRDMGFTNAEASLAALRKTNGDLNAAVNLLVKASAANAAATAAPAAPATASMEQRLSALSSMGFKDEEANRRALAQTNGNVNEAVNLLVKGSVTSAAKPAASPAKAPANLLGDDLFGDVAPAAAPAASAAGGFDAFGGFGAAPPTQAAKPQAAPAPAAATSSDLFSDFVATSAAPAPKPSKNDILGLYAAAPAPQATGPSFGAPVPQAAPQQAFFGGAPATGAYGAPPGAYGAPAGAYGAPAGAYGAPQGAYGAPQGAYGAPPGAYGAPAGAYGAPPGAYGAPQGAYGAPQGAYGAPAGAYGAPQGAYGAPAGAYGGAPGGNPFGAPAAAAPAGGAGGYNPYNSAGFTQPPPGPAPGNPFASSGAAKPSAQQDPFSALSWK